MARIPYRHVELPTPPSPAALAVRSARDAPAVLAACDALLAGCAPPADLGHALEAVVRTLAANRRALLPHRAVAPTLTAIVKDPWCATPALVDEAGLLEALPAEQTVSVRLDPALRLRLADEGRLGRAVPAAGRLRFTRGRTLTAEVEGPPDRLELLALAVRARPELLAGELAGVALPKDMTAFTALASARAAEIELLLLQGRELVERAEQLTCRLYGVPLELEDEVIAHAVARAARAKPPADD